MKFQDFLRISRMWWGYSERKGFTRRTCRHTAQRFQRAKSSGWRALEKESFSLPLFQHYLTYRMMKPKMSYLLIINVRDVRIDVVHIMHRQE